MAKPAGNASHILHLLRDGPQTAQALAARLGLDVSSVRRHLDGLEQRGLTSFEDRVDGPGRPRRHYALTEAGWESFPRDYALLLGALLERLQANLGREAILAAFSDLADGMAGGIDPDQPVAARLEALRRLYLDLGFEPAIEATGAGPCLVQRNCPFLKTARGDPEGLCDCLDEGIMRRVLPEARVELLECMATGDNLCRHSIVVES